MGFSPSMIPPCGFAPLGVLVAGAAVVVDMLDDYSAGCEDEKQAMPKACAGSRTGGEERNRGLQSMQARSNTDKKSE